MIALVAAVVAGVWPGSALGAPEHRFEAEWSGCGSTEFARPIGVAVDRAGDAYVVDGDNNSLYIFAPTGACLGQILELSFPRDVAVDSNGVIYVLVYAPPPFLANGRLLRISPSKFPPDGMTSYANPVEVAEGGVGENFKSVAVDETTNHVYVTAETHVEEFGPASDGSPLIDGDIGSGVLLSAAGIAIDEGTHDVLVSVTNNPAAGTNVELAPDGPGIYRFDGATHAYLGSIDGSSRPQGKFASGGESVSSVDVDQERGHILAWDLKFGIADEFEPDGQFVDQIGPGFGAGASSVDGEMNQLAIANGPSSPNHGSVYIASDSAKPPRVYVYGPLEEPRPLVKTQHATEVEAGSANLHGTVNPMGLPVSSCRFEYVPAEQYEVSGFASAASVACGETLKKIGSGTSPVNVHVVLSGLPDEPFVFRVAAENENGVSSGAPMRFGRPTVETLSPSSLGHTEATLTGAVNPNGFQTEYFFEYGPTESYGGETAAETVAADEPPKDAQAALTGLAPGHAYHYRLVARNEVGITAGADRTFTTYPLPPVQTCSNAAVRVGASALLPDCRAYELVTPPFMHGLAPTWRPGEAAVGNFPTRLASVDGKSLVFDTEGAIPGTPGNGLTNGHRAMRGSQGWTASLYGPGEEGAEWAFPGGVSPDHAFSFWQVGSTNGSLALNPAVVEPANYVFGPEGPELVGVGPMGTDPEAIGRRITAGGAHLIFTSTMPIAADSPPAGELAVYDRKSDSPGELLSVLPDGETASAAKFVGSSADGSSVAFGEVLEEEEERLFIRHGGETFEVATGYPTFAGFSSDGTLMYYELGGSLYRYSLATASSQVLASGGEATFVNVSADGSHAYFSSTLTLTGAEENSVGQQAIAGDPNLFVWNATTDSLRFVATLDPQDLIGFGGTSAVSLGSWAATFDPTSNGVGSGPGIDPSRSTPDGRVLVFQSHASLTPFDADGVTEIYRYEEGGPITCISCPFGRTAESEARLERTTFEDVGSSLASSLTILPNVSDDGRLVFFVTGDPLVAEDVNGKLDVYEWNEGRVALISTGRGSANSYLYAVTPSGEDVFFTTTDSLLPRDDVEHGISIYDARVGGGFPEPPAGAGCVEDSCQGPLSSSPRIPVPASEEVPPSAWHQRSRRCGPGKRMVRRDGMARCLKKPHRHRRSHTKRRAGR